MCKAQETTMNEATTAAQLAQAVTDAEDVVDESVEEDTTDDEATEGTDSRETQTFSPAIIPNKEELALICADIKKNFNFDVDVRPTLFRFKTAKDDNGIEVKRDAMELPIPFPSVSGVVSILENGATEEGKKALELLMDAVEGIVIQQARSLISDDWDLNATNLPVDKLSWEFIANMPKAERSGGGIAKEVWEDFGKDYIKTMPEVTGKKIEQVTQASKLLVGKFAACKTNKPVLNLLLEQLTIYISSSKRADEFAACVEFLVDKADKLLNVTPEELLANL